MQPLPSSSLSSTTIAAAAAMLHTHHISQQPAVNSISLETSSQNCKNSNYHENPLDLLVVWNTWRYPLINVAKLLAICIGFFVLGMVDSSIGVMIHNLERYYNESYSIISLIFVTPAIGYLVAAFLNERLHRKMGRWGVGVLGTLCIVLCFTVLSCRPPLGVFITAYGFSGFGNGFVEASWTSWVGELPRAGQIMAVLYGCHGLGGILCPLIITAMLEKRITWNYCFLPLLAMSVISLLLVVFAFWGDGAAKYNTTSQHLEEQQQQQQQQQPQNDNTITYDIKRPGLDPSTKLDNNYADENQGLESSFLDATAVGSAPSRMSTSQVLISVLTNKTILNLALLHIFYLGAEVTFSGWITAFLIDARHGPETRMGYVTTGYWVGLTIGTGCLGFIMGKFKQYEGHIATVLLVTATAVILLLWVLPDLLIAAILVISFGVIIGPIFPTMMTVSLQKIPDDLKMTGIGYVTALGGLGSAMFPFISGLLTDHCGIWTFVPFMIILLSSTLILWTILMWSAYLVYAKSAMKQMIHKINVKI